MQELSVTENIFLGNELKLPGGRMDYPAMHRRAAELLARLKLDDVNVGAPVMHYGNGHQQLFEIARALAKQARLLIFDEPTSSLSAKEIEVLLAIIEDLKRAGVACIYISQARRGQAGLRHHHRDPRRRACRHPAGGGAGRERHHRPDGRPGTDLALSRTERQPGEVVLEARGVTCWDVTNPRRKRVDDAGLQVRAGEILASPACGRGPHRTRVRDLRRLCRPQRGAGLVQGRPVRIGSPADAIAQGICLVPEDRKRHGIVPQMSVAENITLATLADHARATRVDAQSELAAVEREIARLRIKTASPGLPVASLSGGNQQKVVLAKMALKNPGC